ncbi:Flp pilus assembly protein CpaB [Vibrio tapetis subsp. quintayensis]|uniref:Flp pilus assembly protein CpaB n=1 Tax=Vibrio tapetis TaxID=52443 RepID=UPI0025B59EB8|nr:Flp pilus assembly protein CpaB [Vibrio tapetis]MDN3680457.1 Flp pilus assembly protein CpaB [Vibrio tapetis subsp. quintayensis]
MKIRFLLYILLAGIIAAGGYVYWQQSLNTSPSNTVKSSQTDLNTTEESVTAIYQGAYFLTANRSLAKGSLVQESDLIWRQKREDEEIADLERYYLKGIAKPQTLAGFVVRHAIKQGEFVNKASFIRPGDFNYLSAVLKPGMRAVSIPIDVISGSSGLIKPGNSVDVIITTNLEGGGMSGRELSSIIAKTILSNVRVLAINQNVENLVETQAFDLAKTGTATLETTAKQAELLTVARKMGELSLSLRSEFVEIEPEIMLDESTTTASQVTDHFKQPIASPSVVLMHGIKRRNLSVADSGVEVLAD